MEKEKNNVYKRKSKEQKGSLESSHSTSQSTSNKNVEEMATSQTSPIASQVQTPSKVCNNLPEDTTTLPTPNATLSKMTTLLPPLSTSPSQPRGPPVS